MRMASMRESRDSDRFLVNTQVQSHALLRRGFGTSVPFILIWTYRLRAYAATIEWRYMLCRFVSVLWLLILSKNEGALQNIYVW